MEERRREESRRHSLLRSNVRRQLLPPHRLVGGARAAVEGPCCLRPGCGTRSRQWRPLLGRCIDKKCPLTGIVSIRGRIIVETCHRAKMNRNLSELFPNMPPCHHWPVQVMALGLATRTKACFRSKRARFSLSLRPLLQQ